MSRLNHIGNIFSQGVNVILFNGNSNESVSGRCYRENRVIPMRIINAVFFWQNNHCRGANNADVKWAKDFLKANGE